MENILIITHGSGGDVKPFIKIGRMIVTKGYNVTILTHCIYENEVKLNNLNFVAIDTYEEYKDKNDKLNYLSDAIKQSKEYIEFNKKYCGADRTYKEYKIISQYCDPDTIIIFRHRFSLAGLLAAEKYRLPAISVFLAPNYIQHLQLHEELIGKEMRNEINIVRGKIGLEEISNWTEWMCSPKLKIGLWPNWYAKEEIESINNMFAIGFPEKKNINKYEIPDKIKEFIKGKKKIAIITAGTSNAINPNFYKIAAESCIKAKINGILITAFDEFVPRNLPSTILRLKEAPLKNIMPYANVIIHHGGIGTCSEALACGIPQLIMAHLADRPDNANRLKKLGVAKVFSEINWKTELIRQAIVEVIDDEVLLIDCKKISKKTDNDNIEGNIDSIMKEISEYKDKYIVTNYKSKESELFNKEKIIANDKGCFNRTSDKRKKVIMNLLINKSKGF